MFWYNFRNQLFFLGQAENSETSEISEILEFFFFSSFLNPSFQLWLQYKTENSEMKNLRIAFLKFPSFRFTTFLFSRKKNFPNITKQFIPFVFTKPFKLFFLEQNYKLIRISPSHNQLYMLCDVSILKRLFSSKNYLKRHSMPWRRKHV